MQKLLALGSLQKCTSHKKRQTARMQGRLVINYSLGWADPLLFQLSQSNAYSLNLLPEKLDVVNALCEALERRLGRHLVGQGVITNCYVNELKTPVYH